MRSMTNQNGRRFEGGPQARFLVGRRAEHQSEMRADQTRLAPMILRAQPPQRGVVSLAQERPGDDIEHC